uniref:Uncharacterized protein n=1 Tax=Oryza rufipogon TaxID=4529 RepID=A0A0E0N285_ORYRU
MTTTCLIFFSQSQAHHEAASVDAAEYRFSQASSGYGGSGAGYHFLGRRSAGLDLNSQAEDFPDFGSYQQILQEDGGGIPPLFQATRSNVAPSRRPVPGSRGGRRGGRSRGRGRGRDGTIGAAAGNRMRGFVPPGRGGSMSNGAGVVGHGSSMSHSAGVSGRGSSVPRCYGVWGLRWRRMGCWDVLCPNRSCRRQLPKRRTTTLRTMMKTTTMVSTR